MLRIPFQWGHTPASSWGLPVVKGSQQLLGQKIAPFEWGFEGFFEASTKKGSTFKAPGPRRGAHLILIHIIFVGIPSFCGKFGEMIWNDGISFGAPYFTILSQRADGIIFGGLKAWGFPRWMVVFEHVWTWPLMWKLGNWGRILTHGHIVMHNPQRKSSKFGTQMTRTDCVCWNGETSIWQVKTC